MSRLQPDALALTADEYPVQFDPQTHHYVTKYGRVAVESLRPRVQVLSLSERQRISRKAAREARR